MDTDMCQKAKGLVQACGVNDSLNQIGSSCRFKHLLTRQACASMPGQICVKPTWIKQTFDPASLYKLAGPRAF